MSADESAWLEPAITGCNEIDVVSEVQKHELGLITSINDASLRKEHFALWNAHVRSVHCRGERKKDKLASRLLGSSKKRLRSNNDPTAADFSGPWSAYEDDKVASIPELVVEEMPGGREGPLASDCGDSAEQPISFEFHGDNRCDYQGRRWLEGPAIRYKASVESSFPKQVVHTYRGHSKAVLRQSFIPKAEHLLLTCSMDRTCKIWDVFSSRECLATYRGHSKGVKDIGFTADGAHFFSCGMDSKILHWDTETGQIVSSSLGNGKLPLSLQVHPEDSNIILCGHQNKAAVQYDARTGEIAQQYTEHLAAVNTATFCDSGRKIVTTSDDKRMFVWEFGINVVMKHIAEPYMSSMPAVTLDPKSEFLACQSMDNQIVLYEANSRFRLQSRRRFKGHHCSGYAIKPGFSPDSRYLASGDINGHLWIWDYPSSKVLRSGQSGGHTGAIMSVLWNSKKSSLITTAGWDGNVNLWE